MRVRAIDAENDWTFGKGRSNYYIGGDAIIQNIKTRLQSFLGNCPFDLSAGVDWFNLMGSKNQLGLELAVRTLILNTPFVSGILKLDIALDRRTRGITMTYSITTAYSKENESAIEDTSSFILSEDGFNIISESGALITAG